MLDISSIQELLDETEDIELETERHRIKENFSQETIEAIIRIDEDPYNTDNNMKVEKILALLAPLGFTEIGPGTNRLTVRGEDYVYKIAMDAYGRRDNLTEFARSPELQPFVTKTYECMKNGLIAVAEYVNLMTKEEFTLSKENIRHVLSALADEYIFCDLGTISKNYLNFGFRENGDIVILDFGYIMPIDRKILFCKKCASPIVWNKDFSGFVCTKCGKKYDVIEIRDRMWKDEKDFDPPEKAHKPITIKLAGVK